MRLFRPIGSCRERHYSAGERSRRAHYFQGEFFRQSMQEKKGVPFQVAAGTRQQERAIIIVSPAQFRTDDAVEFKETTYVIIIMYS